MSLSLTIRCENRCSPVPDKVKRGEKQKQKKRKKRVKARIWERERETGKIEKRAETVNVVV